MELYMLASDCFFGASDGRGSVSLQVTLKMVGDKGLEPLTSPV